MGQTPKSPNPHPLSGGKGPRTPLVAKLLIVLVVGYALSPVDLIPDFVPLLGYLDDLILFPLGVALAIKMIPEDIFRDCRSRQAAAGEAPSGRVGAVLVIYVWLLIAAAAALLARRLL